ARIAVDDIAVVALERIPDVTGHEQGLVVVDVLPSDRMAAEARGALDGRRAAWLAGREAERLLGVVRPQLPAFGGGRAWEVEGLSDAEWAALERWLVGHVRVPVLRSLLLGQ